MNYKEFLQEAKILVEKMELFNKQSKEYNSVLCKLFGVIIFICILITGYIFFHW